MKKLRKILQVNKYNLDNTLKKYKTKNKQNPKKNEKIFTTFDLFFNRCLFIAIDRNIINNVQRDELEELFKSQIKTDV